MGKRKSSAQFTAIDKLPKKFRSLSEILESTPKLSISQCIASLCWDLNGSTLLPAHLLDRSAISMPCSTYTEDIFPNGYINIAARVGLSRDEAKDLSAKAMDIIDLTEESSQHTNNEDNSWEPVAFPKSFQEKNADLSDLSDLWKLAGDICFDLDRPMEEAYDQQPIAFHHPNIQDEKDRQEPIKVQGRKNCKEEENGDIHGTSYHKRDLPIADCSEEGFDTSIMEEENNIPEAISFRASSQDKDKNNYEEDNNQGSIGFQENSYEESSEEDNEESDGLSHLWKEMSIAQECSNNTQEIVQRMQSSDESECMHSYILQEDLGYVCTLCGVIGRSAETIFHFEWSKPRRKSTQVSNATDHDVTDSFGGNDIIEEAEMNESVQNYPVLNLVLHPRLERRMHPHQLDGFEFLKRNIISEKPGGCILAHAPGTGKTFLAVGFIHSFLAKYTEERPLIITPKPVITNWMRELKDWEVEEVPLYNLYEANSKSEPARSNHLEVLKEWRKTKSILLVSYAQFSSIVSEKSGVHDSASYQSRQILLESAGLIVLDEGHFPRNQNTVILNALMHLRSRRRILLTGTLFQNNVTELFNLLKLVRPDIHKEKSFIAIYRHILAIENRPRVTQERMSKNPEESIFCGYVEHSWQHGTKEMKASAVGLLRELLSPYVHYYKGEILESLPGLTEMAVFLRLNVSQLEAYKRLRQSSLARLNKEIQSCLVCIHPSLQKVSNDEKGPSSGLVDSDDSNISDIIADPKDGVKTKFVLDMLSLCNVNGEKLLVFSEFLSPLNLLENMIIKTRNWIRGGEILRLDGKTSPEDKEIIIEKFNRSEDAKVLFASIKACGEGISLIGASRVVILDIPWNPSIARQAISRAFRIGQKKKVYAYRLIGIDTIEEGIYRASFDKEVLSRMIFDENDHTDQSSPLMTEVDKNECEDPFFESKALKENVKVIYKLKVL